MTIHGISTLNQTGESEKLEFKATVGTRWEGCLLQAGDHDSVRLLETSAAGRCCSG